MKRLRVELDVQPVSAFRANAAKLIEQVQAHKRALVLTQTRRVEGHHVEWARRVALWRHYGWWSRW